MNYIPLLRDPNFSPDSNVLKDVLGKGYSAYVGVLELYDKNEISYEWRYYKDGKTWLCKATKKKKTIVWMSAMQGFIRATIYFPAKYLDGVYQLKISDELLEIFRTTKNTGKSKGCTFEISTTKILSDFYTVMQYKLSLK